MRELYDFYLSSIAALSIGTSQIPCNYRVVLLETVDSDPVPQGTIRNVRSHSIMLRVSLIGKNMGREISAHALVDSGAKGIIIGHEFARQHKLMLRTLKEHLLVRNVDGSNNKAGAVKSTMIQKV